MAEFTNEYDEIIAEIKRSATEKSFNDDQLNSLIRPIENIRVNPSSEPSIDVFQRPIPTFIDKNLPWQPQGAAVLDMVKNCQFKSQNLFIGESEQTKLLNPIFSTFARTIFQATTTKNTFEHAMMFEGFKLQAQRLDAGGALREAEAERSDHIIFLKQIIAKEKAAKEEGNKSRFPKPGVDAVAFGNKCSRPVDELEAVTLTGLKSHCVNKGKVLWVTTIAPAGRVSGIILLVKDSEEKVVTVALYNFVTETTSISDCQHLFPEGTRLAIKEPYLKCSNTGYLGIRVDHVCNVERPDGLPVSLLLSTKTSSTNIIRPAVMDVNDIKSKGN
eukprot:gene8305-17080_t